MGQETQVDAEMQRLLACAARAAENSYSPYSSFRVGAALRLSNGETVTGTNVENVSYGLTICAERSALVHAVSQFGPKIRVVAVAVANLNHAASPPCGACRQTLSEFGDDAMVILYPGENGAMETTLGELLPHAFRGTLLDRAN